MEDMAPSHRRARIRAGLLVVLCGWLFLLHAVVILGQTGQTPETMVGDTLLSRTVETGSANAVTAVVVSYRGFDTLGEVTVLFLAATGIGMLFSGRREAPDSSSGTPIAPPPSEMMTSGVRLLFPVLLLFGVYVIVHGHLSPGGGFQGGVIIATAFLLRMLADRQAVLPDGVLTLLESLSGSGFVLFGLLGLVLLATGTFLGNFLPHPAEAIGRLVSAGVTPLIYVLVGIKVGAEVGAIVQNMLEPGPREEA